jgi:hypothetical protein
MGRVTAGSWTGAAEVVGGVTVCADAGDAQPPSPIRRRRRIIGHRRVCDATTL